MDKYQNSVFLKDMDRNIKSYVDLYAKPQNKSSNSTFIQLIEFENAFKKEFGFNFELPHGISQILLNYMIDNELTYLDISKDELIQMIQNLAKTNTIEEIKKCISYFTLNVRKNFEEPKGSPYSRNNNVWLYKRPLSLLYKPYIAYYPSRFLIFPRLLIESVENFICECFNGELDHEFFGKEMQKYFGQRVNRIGQDFNNDVAKWFSDNGYVAKSNVKMTVLGVKKSDTDLGDIDVIIFDKANNIIFIIECKDLIRAKTPKEIGQQVKRFLAGSDRWLYRHIIRFKWIVDNKCSALKKIKLGNKESKIAPVLLVNDIIPLQFMNKIDYPIQNIITMSQLKMGYINKVKLDYYPK